MPQQNLHKSAEETTSMCLKLFTAIGADVSINDVEIAHRVPARNQSVTGQTQLSVNLSAVWRKKKYLLPESKLVMFSLSNFIFRRPRTELDNLQIYQHLTPRLQELLFEANKYKRENHFKFCWVKNKIVCLRKTENDQIIKLAKLQDLTVLR